jgi:hypothetical protein
MRLSGRFTLTAGLRYSYAQAMKEARNNFGGLGTTIRATTCLRSRNPVTGAGPNMRERWVDPDWNNFAPRVGVAYLLNNKTTIRAGAGIYYSIIPNISPISPATGLLVSPKRLDR